ARRTVDRDPWSQRRDVAERRPSGLRAIPVFLGTCSLAGVLFTEHRNTAHAAGLSNSGSWILLAGLLAIILGAPSAAPTITRAVAHPLLHLPGLSWHLAAARARHHAVSTARISGAIMIITVTSGVTIGVWDIAHSRYDHSTRGSLELSLASSTQTSWVREQAVELLTRDDLISATVTHDWEKNPQEPFELLTRKEQIRGDDLGYSFVFPSSVARTVAAQVEKSHPGEQTAMFDHELSGPYAVIQESAAVLLAQFFSVLIVFLSLVTGLISLQQDRAVPDMALLISGLSRNRLRLARTHEILLTVLPSTLLATAVAWFAAQAVAHVDDPTIDVHTGPLIALSLGVVGLGLLLAGVAAATTPALNPAVLRRD
ncbi:MAG: hypothetical protein QG608_3078, partial [Actinomycetota bacterium]|nr:hypothetical protein [Actinomycetota bacterium]